MRNRRMVRVPITIQLLQGFIVHGMKNLNISVDSGIPEDAQYVGSTTDERNLTAYLFFSHPSFDEIPEGQMIPDRLPIIQIINSTIGSGK
jgi:hypothetical protein